VRPTTRWLVASAIAASVVHPGPARADPAAETRLREALRSAQMQIRNLEDDRSRWQQSEAEFQKELAAAKKELAAQPRAQAGANERALSELRQRMAEEQGASAKLKASLAACEASSQEAAALARTAEADRAKLKAEAAKLGEQLSAAATRNAKIYRLGRQVIDWVSTFGAREESEILLGLERVRLENMAQAYDDLLSEQRIQP
jgi:septal ring factor EnvC (AmiA/AmiB activator)